MFSIVRMAQDLTGGPLLMPPQATVFVEGALWALFGTPGTPHGPGPHAAPTLIQALMNVFIGGIPASHMTHTASCGCPAGPGSSTVCSTGGGSAPTTQFASFNPQKPSRQIAPNSSAGVSATEVGFETCGVQQAPTMKA